MRALALVADRKLDLTDLPAPPAPAAGEVQVSVKAVALNYLDLWGYRGMAFAKRKMPVVVGVEAAGNCECRRTVSLWQRSGFRRSDNQLAYRRRIWELSQKRAGYSGGCR